MILSFGWTWPAFVARAKTCTRRFWTPRYAERWVVPRVFEAYDRSPRFGGVRIGMGRLSAGAIAVKFRKENKMPGLGEVDMKLVGDLVRQKRKRENMSLREAAVQVRISAPTLQRVETGQLPTVSVLVRVADWLGVKVDDLRQRPSESPRGTVAQIEIFLRADPNLDRKAAAAIANIVREVYDGLVKGKKGK